MKKTNYPLQSLSLGILCQLMLSCAPQGSLSNSVQPANSVPPANSVQPDAPRDSLKTGSTSASEEPSISSSLAKAFKDSFSFVGTIISGQISGQISGDSATRAGKSTLGDDTPQKSSQAVHASTGDPSQINRRAEPATQQQSNSAMISWESPDKAYLDYISGLLAKKRGGVRPDGEPRAVIALSEGSVVSVLGSGAVLVADALHDRYRRVAQLSVRPDVAAFSPGGRVVAYAVSDSLVLRDLMTGQEVRPGVTFDFRITSLALHPVDPVVLIGAANGSVYRWDLREHEGLTANRAIERYRLHPSAVSSVLFHPLGRLFMSADWSGNVVVWLGYSSDAFEGRYDKDLLGGRFFTGTAEHDSLPRSGNTDEVSRLLATADGQRTLVATDGGALELYQVRGNLKLGTVTVGRGSIVAVALWPKGDIVAAALRDGSVQVYRMTPKVVATIGQAPAVDFGKILEVQIPGVRELVVNSSGHLMGVTAQGNLVAVDKEIIAL